MCSVGIMQLYFIENITTEYNSGKLFEISSVMTLIDDSTLSAKIIASFVIKVKSPYVTIYDFQQNT